jgi:error-prone DNA polymerase
VKPRIDPSTRTLLEPAPTLPTPGPLPTSPGRGFVELCARTSFSGVTIEGYGTVDGRSVHDAQAAWPGAGLPEEVVTRAAVFGQDTVAIADIDTVAGVVRAHDRGKELGVGVIPGCELLLDEGSLVLLPMDARGWANLCAILTIAKDGTLERGVQKDDVEHRLQTVIDHASSLQAIAWPPFADHALLRLRDAFGDRLSVGLAVSDTPDDDVAVAFVDHARERFGIAALLSARPLLVDEADGPLLDVLCCIRQHRRLSSAGQRVPPNRLSRMMTGDNVTGLFHRHR